MPTRPHARTTTALAATAAVLALSACASGTAPQAAPPDPCAGPARVRRGRARGAGRRPRPDRPPPGHADHRAGRGARRRDAPGARPDGRPRHGRGRVGAQVRGSPGRGLPPGPRLPVRAPVCHAARPARGPDPQAVPRGRDRGPGRPVGPGDDRGLGRAGRLRDPALGRARRGPRPADLDRRTGRAGHRPDRPLDRHRRLRPRRRAGPTGTVGPERPRRLPARPAGRRLGARDVDRRHGHPPAGGLAAHGARTRRLPAGAARPRRRPRGAGRRQGRRGGAARRHSRHHRDRGRGRRDRRPGAGQERRPARGHDRRRARPRRRRHDLRLRRRHHRPAGDRPRPRPPEPRRRHRRAPPGARPAGARPAAVDLQRRDHAVGRERLLPHRPVRPRRGPRRDRCGRARPLPARPDRRPLLHGRGRHLRRGGPARSPAGCPASPTAPAGPTWSSPSASTGRADPYTFGSCRTSARSVPAPAA